MPTDRESLNDLDRIDKGNWQGLSALLRKFGPGLYSYLLLLNERDYRIIERFQDLFLEAVSAAGRRGVKTKFPEWLFQRARTVSQGYLVHVDGNSPDLEQELSRLSILLRQVLFLKHQLNFPWDQVGEILGIPETEAKEGIRQILSVLRIEQGNRPAVRQEPPPDDACRLLDQNLGDFLYATLPGAARQDYQRHILNCGYCRNRMRRFQDFLIRMDELSLTDPPASALTQILSLAPERFQKKRKKRRIFLTASLSAAAAAAGIFFMINQGKGPHPDSSSKKQNPGVRSAAQESIRPPDKKSPSPVAHDAVRGRQEGPVLSPEKPQERVEIPSMDREASFHMTVLPIEGTRDIPPNAAGTDEGSGPVRIPVVRLGPAAAQVLSQPATTGPTAFIMRSQAVIPNDSEPAPETEPVLPAETERTWVRRLQYTWARLVEGPNEPRPASAPASSRSRWYGLSDWNLVCDPELVPLVAEDPPVDHTQTGRTGQTSRPDWDMDKTGPDSAAILPVGNNPKRAPLWSRLRTFVLPGSRAPFITPPSPLRSSVTSPPSPQGPSVPAAPVLQAKGGGMESDIEPLGGNIPVVAMGPLQRSRLSSPARQLPSHEPVDKASLRHAAPAGLAPMSVANPEPPQACYLTR